jgi:hypothetical protein
MRNAILDMVVEVRQQAHCGLARLRKRPNLSLLFSIWKIAGSSNFADKPFPKFVNLIIREPIKRGQLYDKGLSLAGPSDKFDLVFSHAW